MQTSNPIESRDQEWLAAALEKTGADCGSVSIHRGVQGRIEGSATWNGRPVDFVVTAAEAVDDRLLERRRHAPAPPCPRLVATESIDGRVVFILERPSGKSWTAVTTTDRAAWWAPLIAMAGALDRLHRYRLAHGALSENAIVCDGASIWLRWTPAAWPAAPSASGDQPRPPRDSDLDFFRSFAAGQLKLAPWLDEREKHGLALFSTDTWIDAQTASAFVAGVRQAIGAAGAMESLPSASHAGSSRDPSSRAVIHSKPSAASKIQIVSGAVLKRPTVSAATGRRRNAKVTGITVGLLLVSSAFLFGSTTGRRMIGLASDEDETRAVKLDQRLLEPPVPDAGIVDETKRLVGAVVERASVDSLRELLTNPGESHGMALENLLRRDSPTLHFFLQTSIGNVDWKSAAIHRVRDLWTVKFPVRSKTTVDRLMIACGQEEDADRIATLLAADDLDTQLGALRALSRLGRRPEPDAVAEIYRQAPRNRRHDVAAAAAAIYSWNETSEFLQSALLDRGGTPKDVLLKLALEQPSANLSRLVETAVANLLAGGRAFDQEAVLFDCLAALQHMRRESPDEIIARLSAADDECEVLRRAVVKCLFDREVASQLNAQARLSSQWLAAALAWPSEELGIDNDRIVNFARLGREQSPVRLDVLSFANVVGTECAVALCRMIAEDLNSARVAGRPSEASQDAAVLAACATEDARRLLEQLLDDERVRDEETFWHSVAVGSLAAERPLTNILERLSRHPVPRVADRARQVLAIRAGDFDAFKRINPNSNPSPQRRRAAHLLEISGMRGFRLSQHLGELVVDGDAANPPTKDYVEIAVRDPSVLMKAWAAAAWLRVANAEEVAQLDAAIASRPLPPQIKTIFDVASKRPTNGAIE